MKTCKICRAKISDDKAAFCPNCGNLIDDNAEVRRSSNVNINRVTVNGLDGGQAPTRAAKGPSIIGYVILSFLLPIFGFVGSIAWRKQDPARAKACLVGFGISLVLFLLVAGIAAAMVFYVMPVMLGMPIF